ncbi:MULTISPECIES: hypothetical protein [Lactococcus]|uniref:hypothetical protein n=1 Tax=Lactococcus TaxID=1357 RepID=UPI0010BF5554|nr:hypothetical protein [Lactococcus lactis]MDS1012656.1 hypothetical protein [Lactococcus lactis]MDS1013904.1 hypothetical protein [Lactococcus lactis]TKD78273.1 hypothetical protein E6O52_04930 [Lactococcus lactis]UXV68075.1 hypothetical protein LLUL021_11650 [Lactococcus lactis subsp. lactis]UXV69258.1 hypothetical protein LLUL021_05575 [Lactococcus lactis subsp. lactis]
MIEKKYYVFLSPLNNGNKPFFQLVSFGFMAELFGFAKCNTKNKNGRYENKYSKFTKSELAEIMGGAIYKKEITDVYDAQTEQMGFPEWINPLIELVPVEDGE